MEHRSSFTRSSQLGNNTMLAPPLVPVVAHWRERPQRTWSVVITVFGDAVVPRGGTVWLATLVELFAALGIDAGAVRTAMSRLVADGWTERTKLGRNSAYRLAEKGQSTFATAAARIYAPPPPPWDGYFRAVVQPRDKFGLMSAGYGQVTPGLWIAAGAAPFPPGEPVTLEAKTDREAARWLVARAWPLERLAASFHRFNETFKAMPSWIDPPLLDAMVARTLLIHEYRRIVLQAPVLPVEILPPDWPGETARALCEAAYSAMLPASEAWLTDQDMPRASPDLAKRFRSCVTYFP